MPDRSFAVFERKSKLARGTDTARKFHPTRRDNAHMSSPMKIASRSFQKPVFLAKFHRLSILNFAICAVINLYRIEIRHIHFSTVLRDISPLAERVGVRHKAPDRMNPFAYLLGRNVAKIGVIQQKIEVDSVYENFLCVAIMMLYSEKNVKIDFIAVLLTLKISLPIGQNPLFPRQILRDSRASRKKMVSQRKSAQARLLASVYLLDNGACGAKTAFTRMHVEIVYIRQKPFHLYCNLTSIIAPKIPKVNRKIPRQPITEGAV